MTFLYELAESLGYNHPLHPPTAHIPIGIIVALLVFAVIAAVFRRHILSVSAYYPLVALAFLASLPVALLGYGDWKEFYQGAMSFQIKVKLILTAILLSLLGAGVILALARKGETLAASVIYFLSLVSLAGLGYFGAELVYGTPVPTTKIAGSVLSGERLYASSCASCHPNTSSMANSPRMARFSDFLSSLREPPAGMPAYSPLQLPPSRAMDIYHYLLRYPCLTE